MLELKLEIRGECRGRSAAVAWFRHRCEGFFPARTGSPRARPGGASPALPNRERPSSFFPLPGGGFAAGQQKGWALSEISVRK